MEQITRKQIEEVKEFIEGFVSERGVVPLMLVESGSRMWEFASEDSDFDVRGLHLTSLEFELGISMLPEQYEAMDGLMDVVSYNIDKYFKLLLSSNPNLLEQLQSGIIYESRWQEFGVDFEEFRGKVFELVNLKTLFYHYLSMAHKNYDKYVEDKFTYKKSLYVFRSLYAAKYVYEKKRVPPVVFLDLISELGVCGEEKEFIDKILELKGLGDEKTLVDDLGGVKKMILSLFGSVENLKVDSGGDKTELKKYLNEVAIGVKKKCYLE